jgi:L-lactate dehydrogenase complex protein LldG
LTEPLPDPLTDPSTDPLIDELIASLRANSCTVSGPMTLDEARGAIVERAVAVATETASPLGVCNADVPVTGLVDALVASGLEVLAPGDPSWSTRLADAAVGITGARMAVVRPAAIALVAAPGSPRATSLVPPEHICVVRVADVVATLADAMQTIAAGELPSALTWIGGPSRTGDLEMITTLGVHGPRGVEVVLVV